MLDLEQLCVAFLAIDRNDVDGATARFDGLFTEREGPSQTGQVSRKSLRPASSVAAAESASNAAWRATVR